MKKLVTVGLVLVLAAVILSPSAMAFEASADAYVGVYSKYLWRGFDLSSDDDFVVQPGVDVSVGNFTASFWGNISENSGEMNEVDLTLDYSTDLGELVSVSVGNIMYNLDFEDAPSVTTNEVYLGVTLNTILEPTLTVYVDYDEFNAVYTTLGVGHSFDLNDKLSLSLGATASYLADDEDNLGTNDEWFHNAELSAGLDYALGDNITLGVSALYSTPLSDDAEDIADIEDEFAAGAAITYAF